MAKVTDIALKLAAPIAEANDCSIWDIEYIKEAGSWFLRIYLDRPEGVTVEHCEAVSRALSDALDEADPIEGSYVLEVSSPGADRALKTEAHFAQFMGTEVEVRLYRAVNGAKAVVGILAGYEKGDVTLETPAGPITIIKQDVAQVRLTITF